MTESVKFKKNEVIFREGEVGKTMYDIVKFGEIIKDFYGRKMKKIAHGIGNLELGQI